MDKQTLSTVLDEILTKRDLVEKKFLEVEEGLNTNTETSRQRYTYVLGQLDAVNEVYTNVMTMLLEAHN